MVMASAVTPCSVPLVAAASPSAGPHGLARVPKGVSPDAAVVVSLDPASSDEPLRPLLPQAPATSAPTTRTAVSHPARPARRRGSDADMGVVLPLCGGNVDPIRGAG